MGAALSNYRRFFLLRFLMTSSQSSFSTFLALIRDQDLVELHRLAWYLNNVLIVHIEKVYVISKLGVEVLVKVVVNGQIK